MPQHALKKMNLAELYDFMTEKCGYCITTTIENDGPRIRLAPVRLWENNNTGLALRIEGIHQTTDSTIIATISSAAFWKKTGTNRVIRGTEARALSREEFIDYARVMFPEADSVFTPLAEIYGDDLDTKPQKSEPSNEESVNPDAIDSNHDDNFDQIQHKDAIGSELKPKPKAKSKSISNNGIMGKLGYSFDYGRMHVYLNGEQPTCAQLQFIAAKSGNKYHIEFHP